MKVPRSKRNLLLTITFRIRFGHMSFKLGLSASFFKWHHAEFDKGAQCLFPQFLVFQKSCVFISLLSKNLWFVTSTNTTKTVNNFKDSLRLWISLVPFYYFVKVRLVSPSNTIILVWIQFYYWKNNCFKKEPSVDNFYFFFFVGLSKILFIPLNNVHIVLAEKICNLVNCSVEKLSFPRLSSKTSSTVHFWICQHSHLKNSYISFLFPVFFMTILLSSIDCCNVISHSELVTIIQFLDLEYRFFLILK